MKKILSFCLLSIFSLSFAQNNTSSKDIKYASIDTSPLDIVYYPWDAATGKNIDPIVKIVYSRPQSKGRTIFGNLVKYKEIWRFGANENTEIKFYKDVNIDNKVIPAGTYSIFAIPAETEWTIIFNKVIDKWGAYTYNEKNDVLRVKVPITKLSTPVEYFSINFLKTETGANLFAAWDTAQIVLPINF